MAGEIVISAPCKKMSQFSKAYFSWHFIFTLGALSGRGTKIALVLIQRKEMSPTAVASDENSASERATALCSACELSAR